MLVEQAGVSRAKAIKPLQNNENNPVNVVVAAVVAERRGVVAWSHEKRDLENLLDIKRYVHLMQWQTNP